MDKEDVVPVYNWILLGHKQKRNCVICRDVNESTDCQTEWSKSKRKNKYILTHICGI